MPEAKEGTDIADTGTLALDHVDRSDSEGTDLALTIPSDLMLFQDWKQQGEKSKVRSLQQPPRIWTKWLNRKVQSGIAWVAPGSNSNTYPYGKGKRIYSIVQYLQTRYKRKHHEEVDRYQKKQVEALVGHGWPSNFG